MKIEIRWVDAWCYDGHSWTDNETYLKDKVEVGKGEDAVSVFRKWLENKSKVVAAGLADGGYVLVDEGDCIELRVTHNGMPFYRATVIEA